MTFLLALIGFILTIGVVVTVHEGGHFLVAKALGVKVLRFSIGMGPVVWRRQVGETEYCLSLLPVGGYVMPLDEDSAEAPIPPEDLPRALNRQPRYKRALIVFAGPAVNFIFAFLCFALVGAIGTRDFAPVLGNPLPDTPALHAGIQAGDRVLAVGREKVHGYTDIDAALVDSIGEDHVPVLIDRAGRTQRFSFSLADLKLDDVATKPASVHLGLRPEDKNPLVAKVVKDWPGEAAGLKVGERILAVNGQPVDTVTQAIAAIARSGGEPVRLTLLPFKAAAQEAPRTVTVTPRQGDDGRWRVGIHVAFMPDFVTVRLGPLASIKAGFTKVRQLISLQFKGVTQMATGRASSKNLGGPIMIADLAGSAVKSGVVPFIEFLAFISVALGFMNLLPIPVLDGGHLFIMGLETLRGRDFTVKTRQRIAQLGMVLILVLTIFVVNNDLSRVFG